MGFMQGVASKVRDFFDREPEAIAQTLPKSGRISERPEMGYANMLNSHGYEDLREALSIKQSLLDRFIDYENMEDYPEISATYDIYADDATQPDFLTGRSLWATSKDKSIEDDLNDMLHKRVQVEDDVWPLARTIAKYGNVYGENLVNETGVIGVNFLPTPTCRRIERENGLLMGFVQDTKGEFRIGPEDFQALLKSSLGGGPSSARVGQSTVTVYEDWEVTHWRLMSKHLRSVYGYGIGEPARWIWKRLMMLEDAMLIYKLTRAPSRYAFYIDTGSLDQQRGLAYVNKVKSHLKRKKFVNPLTGRPDMKYNPLSQDEDFFVPTTGGRDSTRIETLSGPDYQSIEDVEYFQQKMFSALKVPKAYLGKLEEASKAVLSQEDVQFARTIMRIQRVIKNGFKKVCRVHLAAKGIAPSSVDYELNMTTPSTIFDLARMEVWSAQSDLASRMGEMVPVSWILQNVFHFSEGETIDLMKVKDEETVRQAVVDAEAQAKSTEITMSAEQKFEGGEGVITHKQAVKDRSFEKAMTLGITRDGEKKLDAKIAKLFAQNSDIAKKLAKTNMFLQEVRSTMKSRIAA